MTQNRDFFTPESVDEQVEQFSSRQPDELVRLEPGGAPAQAEMYHFNDFAANEHGQDASARLVKELQTFYEADYEQNRAILARARRRIAAHQFAHYDVNQGRSQIAAAPMQHFFQEKGITMQYPPIAEQPTGRKLSRSLGVLAAVLVAGLLVGTLTVMLTLNHGQQGSHGLGGAKARTTSIPTSTPVPVGTILSTQKAPAGTNFGSAAWSPDGTRMAAPTIDPQTGKTLIYIWDSTSGKNLLTFHLDVADLGEVLWSPTGKYLALDNLQTIVIVDSQSGAVVKIINYSAPISFNAPSMSQHQQPWLSSNAALGSGSGFYSVTWSPDGASLAVAVSDRTTGSVVLLDPQTGVVKTTFREQAQPVGLSLSFSSDGKYVAVSYSNDSTIVVWDVATQHVAFVLNSDQSITIGWQPGTHNLARSVFSGTSTSVELWDVDAQKLLKTYKGISDFAWSPDGKELVAYTSLLTSPFPNRQTSNVTIIDADTGDQVGPSISENQMVMSVSWSPDGRTIAIDEASQIVFCTA